MRLEISNITKKFGEKEVLKGISFGIESGKALGLLGRNGAGKTTTIRILMNVFKGDSGSILIDGNPIDYKKIKFGYLPEERGLYPKKKILEQLIYFAELNGMNKKDAEASCKFWLDKIGMSEYSDKRLDTLSKGNQQKIQLVTAIAHNPDIIILDEPFSGLDPVNAMILESVVKEEIANGKIVIFSSHQMNYIEEFCDNIVIINKGNVAISGKIRDIKRSYVRDKLIIQSNDKEKILEEYSSNCEDYGDNILFKMDSNITKNEVFKELSSKYDIDMIKVYEPSLNDIFVEYAG